MGDIPKALAYYRKATQLAPASVAVLYEYGVALQASGDISQAVSVFEQLGQIDSDNAAIQQSLGQLYSQQGLLEKAKRCFDRALALKPDFVEALLGLCTVWNALEHSDQVIACLGRACALRPESAELHFNLGLALENAGRLEAAYQACNRALVQNHEHYPAVALQADIRRREQRNEEAIAILEPVLQAGIRHPRIVDAFVKASIKAGRSDEALSMAYQVCADPATSAQDRMCLHFSSGQILDRLERYDEAFEQIRTANQLRTAYDNTSNLRRFVDDIITVYNTDPGRKPSGHRTGIPGLIFILGMPRSGTTLVEQVLASHPDVYGAGELTAMPDIQNNFAALTGTDADYPHGANMLNESRIETLRQAYLTRLPAASRGAAVITDKQPGNFMAVGLIRTLFPDASIIHCTRHPLDTCLSCYFNNFTGLPYTYNLVALGKTWRQYQCLMRHWQKLSIPMLDLPYEDMVDETEKTCRQLLDFCSLEWNDDCLRFHENKRIVATVSHNQVNRQVYKSSVARWRHYEKHLKPLIDTLGMHPPG